MMTNKNKTVAIVVTYNRKELLYKCLRALFNQSAACDIVLVDNASTDGTQDYLREQGLFDDKPPIHYLRLEENIGGAGGFHEGLKFVMSRSWQWYWLMDDDAEPEQDALMNLLKNADEIRTIYGSTALGKGKEERRLCWPPYVIGRNKNEFIENYELLQEFEDVSAIPFLGFFIHAEMVRQIGLPDSDLFIYSDDQEYCERAKNFGAKIVLVKKSIIKHPLPKSGVTYRLMNIRIVYRSLPPWRIYYYVRNKILVGRQYYGFRLWSQTMPGILFRAFIALFRENHRLKILCAYALAIKDGFSNIKGKRFLPL
ncbi:MAG: glycosyltransferase family 2 protein [Deltaproteobacteria bacterium]|nr:glycosyltransferase family 2 protein [Deltaproteobacteria bacterium]